MSVCGSQMFVNMRCRIHSLYIVSPQWEGELELDSASDSESTEGSMMQDIRDYTSIKWECSLWILIREGGMRRDFFGDIAALWFFLMTNKGDTPATQLPEWPSLGFHYGGNFRFAPRATESREWPDLNTFGCAGTRT